MRTSAQLRRSAAPSHLQRISRHAESATRRRGFRPTTGNESRTKCHCGKSVLQNAGLGKKVECSQHGQEKIAMVMPMCKK